MSSAKVNLTGNLTRDPVIDTTPAGNKVCHFSVAVQTREKDKTTGDFRVNFYDCSFYGAESRINYFTSTAGKGTTVSCDGRLAVSTFQKGNGTTGLALNVVVNDVEAVGNRKQNAAAQQEQPAYNAAPAQQSAPRTRQPAPAFVPPDDELPF